MKSRARETVEEKCKTKIRAGTQQLSSIQLILLRARNRCEPTTTTTTTTTTTKKENLQKKKNIYIYKRLEFWLENVLTPVKN